MPTTMRIAAKKTASNARPDWMANGEANKLLPADRPGHEWYRFVLSFPPHLVRHYVNEFAIPGRDCVLDPFCGTGTTLVECKKLGVTSVGVEANAMAHFASRVKLDWTPDPDGLLQHAGHIAELAVADLESAGIEDEAPGPLFCQALSKARRKPRCGRSPNNLRNSC